MQIQNMRKQNKSYSLVYGLLLPILMSFFHLHQSAAEPVPGTSSLNLDINGCAGTNTSLDICTFCSDIDMELDFMAVLNGNPRAGGTWTDLDNTAIDLSDPNRVDVGGLNTGTFRFRYHTAAGGGCPDDSAILTLNVTGTNTISCVTGIDASLSANCTYEVTVEEVLLGTAVCSDELSVLAFDFETGFNGTVLGEEQVGKELDVVLFKEGCSVPVCNTTLILEDRGEPNISGINWLGDDYTLYCGDMPRIVNNARSWQDPDYTYYLGGPQINDCSGFFVSVTDNVIYESCGANEFATLQRTFIITDEAGNFNSTTQEAVFLYPDRSQIAKLPDVTINACEPNGVPVPDTYPYMINFFGDTTYLREDGCNFSIGFEDRDFFVCGGARKIEREIRYFDWCTDQFHPIDTVVIKIGDFTGPLIERSVDTSSIPTSPFGCGGTIPLQSQAVESLFDIDIMDCNPNVRISGKVETWQERTNSYESGIALHHDTYIDQIPVGLNRFIMTMEDGCKSESVDTLVFRVIDQVPPVMACLDRLIVSMSEGPYATVSFADINKGSSDNCSITSFKVRRQVPQDVYHNYDYDEDGEVLGDELDEDGFTRFDDSQTNGNFVEYHCDDLRYLQQSLELWGWDANGNVNTCWTTVILEDKIPPVCLAPADTVVACYDFVPADLNQFGSALASDFSCGDLLIEELPAVHSTNTCGQGTILRRFQTTKYPETEQSRLGPICVQTITIEAIHDYSICFPADTVLDCGLAIAEMEPALESNGCALFAVNYDDTRVETQNESCYRLVRNYSVINWCEYEGDDSFIQIDRDVDNDNIPGNRSICVVVKPGDTTYLDSNTNPFDIQPNERGYYTSSNSNANLRSTGFWRYTQHIQVVDNTPPSISFPDNLVFESYATSGDDQCFGLATLPISVEESCDSLIDLFFSLDLNAQGQTYLPLAEEYLIGEFPEFEFVKEFPIGQHQLRVQANDACGNTSTFDIPFEILDRYVPRPNCGDLLEIELSFLETNEGRSAFASANLNDLLTGPVFDCNGQGDNGLITDYSINRVDSAIVRGQISLSFDCADADNFVPVEIYAWDELGNRDFCTTFIHVQDNQNICEELGSTGMITGSIQTPEGNRVEQVMVELSGEMNAMYATDASGDYIFESLPAGKNYQIKPSKDDDARNGVSTLDLIQIQKHVLGLQPIVNPYRLIAADVNASASISTLDMIQLRKIILNVDDRFRNNTSWRFVEANYVFPDAQNPWMESFPEVTEVKDMEGLSDLDFVGVKIGDINGNAMANQAQAPVESRGSGQLDLLVDEAEMSAGEVRAVPLKVRSLTEIAGLQGTFSFDPEQVDFIAMEYGLLGPDQFGFFEEDQDLSFSWNYSPEQTHSDEAILFTVYLQAKNDIPLSQAIQIHSNRTETEAYNLFGEVMSVGLVFEQPAEDQLDWKLYTNQPNPFRNHTIFPFYLDRSSLVKTEIYDLQGRRIWHQTEQLTAGMHQQELSSSIFPARGIYYFRMEINGQERTKPILFE